MDQRAMEHKVWNFLRGTTEAMSDDELCQQILDLYQDQMTETMWKRFYKAIEAVQLQIDRHSPPHISS